MNINQYILQNNLLNYQDTDSSILKSYLVSEDVQKYKYIISWPFHMLGQDTNIDYSMKYEYAKKILNLTQSLVKTNYSVKEIAQILNLTESNIKVRLNRGRKLLKKSLREEWIDDDE